MDWAELVTLDLSKYEQPGGKQELVKQLEHAVQHVGKLISMDKQCYQRRLTGDFLQDSSM